MINTMKSSDKLLIVLLVLCVLMMGQIMKENVISIRLAALKPRVDVAKVKTKLQQAGLKLYEAKYWGIPGVQPQKD